MPIVNGKYEAKLSTVFKTPKEGVQAIKNRLEKAKRVRVSAIPMSLLDELLPLVKTKDFMVILPRGQKSKKAQKDVGDVAVTASRIYVDFKGTEANAGSITFSDVMFSILWTKDKILQIETLEYPKCVKCMHGTFDVAWRYAKK